MILSGQMEEVKVPVKGKIVMETSWEYMLVDFSEDIGEYMIAEEASHYSKTFVNKKECTR